jgi:phage terminase large subunit
VSVVDGGKLAVSFVPRPWQRAGLAARARGVKRGVSVVHRRGGKDLRFWNMLWLEALKRKGLYNYYFPTFSLGKKIVWKGMDKDGKRFLDYIPPQVIADKNETDLRLELTNGSIIQIVGTENINQNLVGINPIGVGFSEYPLCNPLAWELTRPILAENDGWAWFMYTPRGRNHGYHLYKQALAEQERDPSRWFCELLTIADTTLHDGITPIITEAQVQQEIAEGMDPDLARQEFFCSFDAPMQGSYYGRLLSALYQTTPPRIAPYAALPGVPVLTGWDLGVGGGPHGDATAIWFAQRVGDDLRLIDYYENVGEGFDFYFKYVMEKPYVYERMFFPHDLDRTDWGTGQSAHEIVTKAFSRYNIGITVVPKLSVNEGIQQVRRWFPRFRIDSTSCGEVKYRGHTALDCLASYHKKWSDERQEYEDHPYHDWASHCADALRYLCVGLREVPTERLQITYKTKVNPLLDVDEGYATEVNPLYDPAEMYATL